MKLNPIPLNPKNPKSKKQKTLNRKQNIKKISKGKEKTTYESWCDGDKSGVIWLMLVLETAREIEMGCVWYVCVSRDSERDRDGVCGLGCGLWIRI